MNGDLSHNYTHDTYLMDMLMNLPQASQLAQIRGLSTWTKILDKRTWDIVSINKLLNKFYRAAQYGQLSYPTLQEGNQYGITFLDIMNFTTLLAIHDCVSMKYSYAQRPYPGTQTPPPLASFFSGSSPTVTQTSSSIPRQERPEITLANEIFKRREEQAGISSQHIVNDMHWVHSFIKLNQDKQQKIISELLNLPAKDKMQGADELLNKINTVVQSTQLNQQAIQEGNKYGITFSDAVNFATLLAIRHNKERRTTSSSTLSISPLLSSLRPNNRLSLSSTSDSRHVERNENSISASPSNDASSMELNNSQQNSSTKKRSRYESNNAIDQNDNQRSMLPPAKRIRATEQNPAD